MAELERVTAARSRIAAEIKVGDRVRHYHGVEAVVIGFGADPDRWIKVRIGKGERIWLRESLTKLEPPLAMLPPQSLSPKPSANGLTSEAAAYMRGLAFAYRDVGRVDEAEKIERDMEIADRLGKKWGFRYALRH